jgi:hypothetical protein
MVPNGPDVRQGRALLETCPEAGGQDHSVTLFSISARVEASICPMNRKNRAQKMTRTAASGSAVLNPPESLPSL